MISMHADVLTELCVDKIYFTFLCRNRKKEQVHNAQFQRQRKIKVEKEKRKKRGKKRKKRRKKKGK